ncbi:zeta toxin family protein [Mycobacteroides abscessus]
MKRLDLVVGSNGAGKSTFIAVTLAPLLAGSVFVNADEIARVRWPESQMEHAYDAAQLAHFTRMRLIEQGRSFIAETVFSHPSKLELIRAAQQAGYVVVLHVLLIPENLAVARVKHRVAAGGHDVPEEKIRGRYQRVWPLVVDAIRRCDSSSVYDNATAAGPRIIAQFSAGMPIGDPVWPAWAPTSLTSYQ